MIVPFRRVAGRPAPWLSAAVVPVLAALLLCVPVPAGAETRGGGQLSIDSPVGEDLYAAAGTLELVTTVDGDAALAGGTLAISGDIASDALLAGGSVDVDGVIGDDLRVAGGNVALRGLVTDQAIVAGGKILLATESAVGGRAWLAGNEVDVQGQVGGNLKVTAREVRLAGRIDGDADLTARSIRIEPGTVIAGNLRWRSPTEPSIAEDAQILGAIEGATGDPAPGSSPLPFASADAVLDSGRVGVGLAIFVAAAVLWRLFPQFVRRAGSEFRAAPGRTLLTGAGAFVATPLVIFVLFVTLIGWLLGLVLLAGYVFGLVAMGLLALAALADQVAIRGAAVPGWGRRLLLLLLLTVAAVLVQAVPGVGSLATVVLWLLGLGMLVRVLRAPGPGGVPLV